MQRQQRLWFEIKQAGSFRCLNCPVTALLEIDCSVSCCCYTNMMNPTSHCLGFTDCFENDFNCHSTCCRSHLHNKLCFVYCADLVVLWGYVSNVTQVVGSNTTELANCLWKYMSWHCSELGIVGCHWPIWLLIIKLLRFRQVCVLHLLFPWIS